MVAFASEMFWSTSVSAFRLCNHLAATHFSLSASMLLSCSSNAANQHKNVFLRGQSSTVWNVILPQLANGSGCCIYRLDNFYYVSIGSNINITIIAIQQHHNNNTTYTWCPYTNITSTSPLYQYTNITTTTTQHI